MTFLGCKNAKSEIPLVIGMFTLQSARTKWLLRSVRMCNPSSARERVAICGRYGEQTETGSAEMNHGQSERFALSPRFILFRVSVLGIVGIGVRALAKGSSE